MTAAAPPPQRPAGPLLVERDEEIAILESLLEATARGGQVAVVTGDAGTGKTSLLDVLRDRARGTAVVRSGRCDALTTAAPFGPLYDMRLTLPPQVVEPLHDGRRELLFAAMVEELRRTRTVLVIDDLHWADEATVDLLRYLARRIEDTRALIVCAYRAGEVDRRHPLRALLGELGARATRIELATLTVDGVRRLTGDRDVDPVALYAMTGGNPFFVTQMLAEPGRILPATVEDAVIARTRTLPDSAWEILDLVGIAPEGLPVAILPQVSPQAEVDADAGCRLELLTIENGRLRARHELIRLALGASVPPTRRRRLHARLLDLLVDTDPAVDAAVLAHHAVGAGDPARTIRHSLEAARLAARDGAHREAAAQYANALRHHPLMDAATRRRALEDHAYERYLIGEMDTAISAIEQALSEATTPTQRGRCLRLRSRMTWFTGDRESALRSGREAVEVLEGGTGAVDELAYAYSNLAQLAMLGNDTEATREWGERAVALAREHGENAVLAHALNNLGVAAGGDERRRLVGESLRLALEHGLEEHAARAYTNLAYHAIWDRELDEGEKLLDAGLRYTEARDLETWWTYMSGTLAELHLERGRWTAAAETAAQVLAVAETPLIRHQASSVAARLAIRKGQPDARARAEEVLANAQRIGEYIRLATACAVAVEYRWHTGERLWDEQAERRVLDQAATHADAWGIAAVGLWRGDLGDEVPEPQAEPLAAQLRGDHGRASALWGSRGCVYEAAIVSALSDDVDARRTAFGMLADLGATGTLQALRRRLAARGVDELPRGPNRATREHPAGLTNRQVDVLARLARGATNAAIAEDLVISPKTVEHHVSAILSKLGVTTRGEAAAVARDRGLVDDDPSGPVG
jgi:DNA-binding CsgD family transcriptional regulator